MITLTIALALLTLFIIVALAYPDRFVGTKARPDLPGPRGVPLLGNLFQLLPHRRRMLQRLSELEGQYGELFTFTMPGRGRSIVINRPEWLEHVRKHDGTRYSKGSTALAVFKEFPGARSAFGSEGQLWKHSRRIMQPIFMSQSFDRHVARALNETIPVLRNFLHKAAESGVVFDFNEFCGRYSLEVLCKATMNLDTAVLTSDPACLSTDHKMMHTVSILNHISSGRLHNPLWRLTEMLDGSRSAFHSAREDLFAVVDKLVCDRTATADAQTTTHAQLESDSDSDGDFLSALLSDPSITDPVLLRDTLITLLFAGRDTTQNALAWSLYELSRRPAWVDRMREEAIRVGGGTETIRHDEVHSYPIHLAVLHETLRLWPGAPKNARLALSDDVLPSVPEHGYRHPVRVSKGDYVLWSDYAMMRNCKVWGPDAREFNPARHLDAHGQFVKPPQPRFHAFGAGPRLCPGSRLATYEFVSFWAALLPLFDFVPVEAGERFPADALTMSMEGSFMVAVKSRV